MRHLHLYALFASAFLVLGAVGFFVTSANVSGQSAVSSLSHRSAAAVVRAAFSTLNADLRTGGFDNLDLIYAPNAVLRTTNLKGKVTYYRGLASVRSFWRGVYRKTPGLHYTEERLVTLDTARVSTSEHAGILNKTPSGRCAHLFSIINGLIANDQ